MAHLHTAVIACHRIHPLPPELADIEHIGFIHRAEPATALDRPINANPRDTKDYPDGVGTLPPTFMKEDEDRDRYLRSLLKDSLGPERGREIAERAAGLDRSELTAYALDSIERELRARRAGDVFRAAVFTDLVTATAFMADKGDREARKIMRRYEELTAGLASCQQRFAVSAMSESHVRSSFARLRGAVLE